MTVAPDLIPLRMISPATADVKLWWERFSQVQTECLPEAVLDFVCRLFLLAFVVEGVGHHVLEATMHVHHCDSYKAQFTQSCEQTANLRDKVQHAVNHSKVVSLIE